MRAASTSRRLRLIQRDPLDGAQPAATPFQRISEPPAPPLRPLKSQERLSPKLAAAFQALADEHLVSLGIKGEVAALEALYRRHAAFALRLATHIEGSTRDAEDTVHDAFLKAFDRLADLADKTAFRPWLGSIVVSMTRSKLRRGRFITFFGFGGADDPINIDDIASQEASPVVRAQLAQVYALLRMLPTDDRIAWTLRVMDGHELDTVAHLTRCSRATVKRRISRAQHFLNEHFVDLAQTDPAQEEATP